jgi:hypothetical protein
MSKLTKNLTLRVPLKSRRVERQPEGSKPALKLIAREISCLQVTVEATKKLGVSRLEPVEDRYVVEIIYVFHEHREVRELFEAIDYLDTLHSLILPLVADEFEGKPQEVAA